MPPSIAMIVYGTFTETSVAKLFMAGVVPGLLLTVMFMGFVGVYAWFRPGGAPAERGASSLAELTAAVIDVVPFGLLISCTIGSIYAGLVTPTEAAAVGCILGLVISAIWGELSWAAFRRAIRATVGVVGNILFIIYAAYVFSYAISLAGVGEQVTSWLIGLHLSRPAFFVALFLLYTVLGCLVESLGMIVITVPLLFPILGQYGIDPVWFGVILVVFIELGQISPPIGINLFVIQSIWDGKLSDVVRGTIPFHLLMLVLLLLLFLLPGLALWLPAKMTAMP
jgi:tripartite ATP-independent transporter DctM subunit